jgi:hypothetical protein
LVRLSNGFSRRIENHLAAVAINYFAYNFIKIHRALRVTPAMEAGIVSRPFDGSDKRVVSQSIASWNTIAALLESMRRLSDSGIAGA